MLQYIYLFAFLVVLTSCSINSDYDDWATGFQSGQIIHDLRPLSPSDSTDLREMAFTLPIIEVREPPTLDSYYKMSESALTQSEWELPADGAQAPVILIRLPNHEDGSQQIELQLHPIPTNTPPVGVSYYSRLKRIEGGWLVMKAWEKK